MKITGSNLEYFWSYGEKKHCNSMCQTLKIAHNIELVPEDLIDKLPSCKRCCDG